MNNGVIFLIDSPEWKGEIGLVSNIIEKETKCKVYHFFSLDETLLYQNLNPNLVIHHNLQLSNDYFKGNINMLNFSDSINKNGETSIALQLAKEVIPSLMN